MLVKMTIARSLIYNSTAPSNRIIRTRFFVTSERADRKVDLAAAPAPNLSKYEIKLTTVVLRLSIAERQYRSAEVKEALRGANFVDSVGIVESFNSPVAY
jgi:hypothetical protein